MLHNELNKNVNTKKFKDIFEHKFNNFVKKSPLLIQYITSNDGVLVKECSSAQQRRFDFDYFADVKLTIKKIRDWIQDYYPVLIQKKSQEVEVSKDEIEKLMASGKFEELDNLILTGKHIVDETEYVITKMIIGTYADKTPRDELFLINKQTNETYHYRMNMPCTLFLKKVREELSPEEGFNLLEKKGELVSVFETKNYENNRRNY